MYQTNMYEGMLAETVMMRGHNGDLIHAYMARPLGPGPFPGMVLLHHALGWDEWYREATRRFAHHGYIAICPNLYDREGHGTRAYSMDAPIQPPSPMHALESADTRADDYFLISFAPASGIGFYERGGLIHQYNLVTDQHSPLETVSDLTAMRLEFDQVEAGFWFKRWEFLRSHIRNEYLRDKKNTYYAVLFTQATAPDLCSKILNFLNNPDVNGLTLSPRLIPILRDIADRSLVSRIMELARRQRLSSVMDCLTREFADITRPRNATNTPEDVAAKVQAAGGVADDQVVGDAEGARRYIDALPYCTGKVGIFGTGSGGRHAVLVACRVRGFDAAIDCWGDRVVMAKEELNPKQPVAPIDLTQDLTCPLLGLFGNDDQAPTPAQVNQHEEELKKQGKNYEFHRYDGAGHGFFYYDRPAYRQEQAVDGWKKVWAFLENHLTY